jgi:hypothetical protein
MGFVKRWRRSGYIGSSWSVTGILLTVWMILLVSGSTAYAESEKPDEKVIDPAEYLFLLDTIDELTVDLAECEKRVELYKETPAECGDGVPWVAIAVSFAAGWVVSDLVD